MAGLWTIEELKRRTDSVYRDKQRIRIENSSEYDNLSWALTGIHKLQLDFKEAHKQGPSLRRDLEKIEAAKYYLKKKIRELENSGVDDDEI